MDGITFIYPCFQELGAGYIGSLGLRDALSDIHKLGYSFDTRGDEFFIVEEANKYPALFMKGHNQGMGQFVDAITNFKASINPESLYTRHGKIEESAKGYRNRVHKFDLMFTFADTDIDAYGIPTIHTSPWADTNVIYPLEVVTSMDLTFVGVKSGREDFFDQDKNKIIKHRWTIDHGNIYENTLELNQLLSKHLFHVSPPGRFYNGMCGRCWEILAAQRMCFQYYNPDTMHLTSKYFVDGFDLVYWQTYDELIDKYMYYLKNLDEAWTIAENGYRTFKNGHTQRHRVEFFLNKIEERIGVTA